MNYTIEDLKEAVVRLEDALVTHETEDVDMCVRLIKNISSQIKTDYWSDHVKEDEIVIQPVAHHNHDYKIINTIEFLYKPMHFVDVYEGNEIEYFAKERSEELLESGAMEKHNDFWSTHEIIYGNVYGSLPLELLPPDNISKLLRCGWKKANVDIVEFLETVAEERIREIASYKYRHYIIIKELETGSYLLLRYNF
ncbi:hypothetical protein [Fusibacter sp. 3D3]|uniref:hypothetical protein n=1 Tax=Fusibacter sp. 3D3 TaxID=1048380 RepID=UPI000852BB1D|nr:hypothetical protein [Fusibacter sp. 3D3]GAU77373.1 hypothetical protein F3D3_2000 [Fusibacter sp. 3D3]